MTSVPARSDAVAEQHEHPGPASIVELWRYWVEDWNAHGRDSTRPGFRALAVHRFGNYRMHWRRPWRLFMSVLYRFMFRYVRDHYSIELPYSARVGRRVVIEHQGAIVIHGDSVIGDESILRQGVTLGNRHLTAPRDAPVLGRGVNVGAGAKILGRVHIGDNACIGANAVVLSDVPADGTAVGIPAKLITTRDDP
jgi:serine O-acetyltransferase